MPPQTHVILREIVEVAVPDDRHAGPIHDAVSRIMRTRLPPLLQRHCDELSGSDTIHRIGRVEIDLGRVPLAGFEQRLFGALEAALAQRLGHAIRGADAAGGDGQVTRSNSHLELADHFARTGTLPWWADRTNPQTLSASLRFLSQEAPRELDAWLQRVVREPISLQRLVRACTNDDLQSLLQVLRPEAAGLLRSLIDAVSELAGEHTLLRGQSPSPTRRVVWQDVLQIAARREQPQDRTILVRDLLRRIATAFKVPAPALIAAVLQRRNGVANRPDGELKRVFESLATEQSHENFPSGHDRTEISEALETQRDRSFKDEPAGSSFSDTDALYVDNAGLVILWPFLERFFARLGLLDEHRFKDESAPHRAASLLQFLVTEEPIPPLEYHLPLNKVLCGLEVDALFEDELPVSDDEQAECERFLGAVIEQAPILHRMSIPGFRGSFLARKGQLSTRDGAWLLRVERETYDVVLDRFPWSVRWVRLPWMKAPMYVEW